MLFIFFLISSIVEKTIKVTITHIHLS